MAGIDIKTLGRSSLTGGAAQLWRILSRFVLTPVIIAEIGLPGYGVWTLIFSVAAYVQMTNVSLGVAYTKFTAECVRHRRFDELNHIIGSGVSVVGSIAALGLLASWWFGEALLLALDVPPALAEPGAIGLHVVVGVMLLRMTVGCSLEILTGLQRIDLTYRLYVLASIVDFLVALPLLLMGWGIVGLAIAHAVGQVLINFIAYFMVRRRVPEIRISPLLVSREGMRKIVSVGGRFQVLAVVNTVVTQGTKMVLSRLVGIEWVGIYELADKLIKLGRTASEAVIAPLMPAFASLRAGGEKLAARKLFIKGSKANVLLGSISFSFLALFSWPILLLWTGEPVPAAAWTLQVLAGGEVAVLLTAIVSSSLRAQGRVRLEFTWAMISTGTLLVLVVPMATWFGFEGIIFSRLIAQLAGATWYLRAYFKFSGITWGEYLRGTRLPRLLVILGATASVILVAHALLPSLAPPSLSPRWGAVVEVALWTLPYLGLVGAAVWSFYLDTEDREQMSVLGATVWARLRGRPGPTPPPPQVVVVSVDPDVMAGPLLEAAQDLGRVQAMSAGEADAFFSGGDPVHLVLVLLPHDGDPNLFWAWMADHRPDLLERMAFVGGDEACFVDEVGARRYEPTPSASTLLADWGPAPVESSENES